MQRRPQRIEPSDLKRMHDVLDNIAAVSPKGMRLRALVHLAHAAALDISDLLALDFRSAITLNAARRWSVEAGHYVTFIRGHKAAPVPMPSAATPYVEAWTRDAARTERIQWPPPEGIPLFHISTGRDARWRRMSPRTVQAQFAALQRAAATAGRYRFSDLRHDAIVRMAERCRSVSIVAQYARISERSALAYLPPASKATLAELDPGPG